MKEGNCHSLNSPIQIKTEDAPYGIVTLSPVSAGYQGWMVFCGGFYQGLISRTERGLVFLPGPGCKLQGDDIAGLMDMVEDIQ